MYPAWFLPIPRSFRMMNIDRTLLPFHIPSKDATLTLTLTFLTFITPKLTNQVIYAAMKEWQEKTCLKFEPYGSAGARQSGHNHKIQIFSGNGNYKS